jgi:hypothetical protein
MGETDGTSSSKPEESNGGRVVIRRPSVRRRLVLYGVLPFLLVGAAVAMYYSEVSLLREVISPDLSWVPSDSRREFGALESLQNLALLGVAVVAIAGLRRKRLLMERLALWVLLVGSAFMLLEETDYGLQYLLLLRPEAAAEGGVPGYFNIHRIGYTQVVLQHIARFGLLTFFGAFAIVFAESRNPVLRYIAPDRFSVLTILLVTALQEIVWSLSAVVPTSHGSLTGNEIEFAELGIYYLALLYAVDVVFRRTFRARGADPAPEGTGAAPAAG